MPEQRRAGQLVEYKSIDASVFAVALLGWSFIPMIMSAHVSFAHAHESGVFFSYIFKSFQTKKMKALQPKMTKIA